MINLKKYGIITIGALIIFGFILMLYGALYDNANLIILGKISYGEYVAKIGVAIILLCVAIVAIIGVGWGLISPSTSFQDIDKEFRERRNK